ncbi:MAG: citramalate synthase [candidate division FCPU426 bacterium]
MKPRVEIFDTTLRDGSQGEDVSFSIEDKLAVAQKLDELGMHFIEGGWPSPANAKDMEFFRRAKRLKLKRSRLVAFGATRRANGKAGTDPLLRSLLKAETDLVCIFGKTWDLHVEKVLRTTLDENLAMISSSVRELRKRREMVFFDAEHFFDGYKRNASYALRCLRAAFDAGADRLVLCDTNGGCLPWEIEEAVTEVVKSFPSGRIGVHVHNDGELAVANTLAAVARGAIHVQGCMNGLGERCGNANLASVIPNLKFKMGIDSIPEKSIPRLAEIARAISSIANVPLSDHQPFVGFSAFAHKAGVHIDAMVKDSRSYEHIPPQSVGNERRMLVSEQAGRAAIQSKAAQYGLKLKDKESAREIMELVKDREQQGYQFEGADASFQMLMLSHLGSRKKFFELESYHVDVERRHELEPSEATVKLMVKGKRQLAAAEGNGPVNAMDLALRKALSSSYPALRSVILTDYKVRVLHSAGGTAAKVRVLIQSTDGKDTWNTVGVHENMIQASWEALVDSLEYKLTKDGVKG